MRILLSTIGSRGDVQPLVALATELRALGADVHLCVPPDFEPWIADLDFTVTPIGPELRTMSPPAPERMRALAIESVAVQFETLTRAARGCDVIVGATALQIAARSIAERMGIRYEFVAFCPTVLPSPIHATPLAPTASDARRFHDLFGATLNAHRASLGLAPVDDVRAHVFTDRPWLASDPTLGPWPDPDDATVLQTPAWILTDDRALTPELVRFLDAGEPPVYFGFGSMRAAQEDLARAMIDAARAAGRRAIVARGWADLAVAEAGSDCLTIGEVNQQALFPRVAAVVHHGGAGTTTAAALCGAPQVVVPQMYDQHYWAKRVEDLGIGRAHAPGAITAASLSGALAHALSSDVAARARALAPDVRRDGAAIAAQTLLA